MRIWFVLLASAIVAAVALTLADVGPTDVRPAKIDVDAMTTSESGGARVPESGTPEADTVTAPRGEAFVPASTTTAEASGALIGLVVGVNNSESHH